MKLLDTNVLAKWGNPETTDEVVPYLQTHADEEFVTSSLVVFEFFRPARRRDRIQEVRAWLGSALDSIEPFTESAGLKATSVEASLQHQNQTLQMRDLLIASHASDLGATFVTCDSGDFENAIVQELLDVDVVRP